MHLHRGLDDYLSLKFQCNRAISRRYDNRRVAASAIDIAISPNR